MSRLDCLYQCLCDATDESVDPALAAALPTADAPFLGRIATTLLERDRPLGLDGLVHHYHLLPQDLQSAVAERASQAARPLREAITQEQDPGAENAIRIIAQAKSLRLAYLLTQVLRRQESPLHGQAADSLLTLVKWASRAGAEGQPVCDGMSAQYLRLALEEALSSYRGHRRPEVLSALAALMPRPLPQAMRDLHERSHPAVPILRQMLMDAATPAWQRSLLVWLAVPSLTSAALAGIQRCLEQNSLPQVLAAAHLLALPACARPLQRLEGVKAGFTLSPPAADMLVPAARALPGWIMALPLPMDEQIKALGSCASVHDELARLLALRGLLRVSAQAPAAHETIATFCFDQPIDVARIALRHLIRVEWPGLARLLLKLVNSPHESMRQLAGQHLAPLGFQRYWEAWPRLSLAQRLAAGQALIKLDPNFHRQVADKLASNDKASRLRALAIIHGLNQAHLFEQALLALAEDAGEVIASSAVRALGSAGTPRAMAALEKALDHPDPRVRANAIEALEQSRWLCHLDKLRAMAADEANRPRASAIHALMSMHSAEAMKALTQMLSDTRPEQRLSALWLLDHLGLIELARPVAEMSLTDPDAQVRSRAGVVMERLIHSMRGPGSSHDIAQAG